MKGRTVILAAGDFPRRGSPARAALEAAGRVVCCDSAADAYRRRTGREPDLVVGDGDSVRGRFAATEWIAEQETNDLEKALRVCAARRWRNPLVLGATGRREDHTLSNVFRALAYGVEILTDYGRLVSLKGRRTFAVKPGDPVSVIAPDPATRMTSRGLVWPLDGVRFANLYCATLNRASGRRVTLASDRPVCVYFPWMRPSNLPQDRRSSRV